MKDITVDEMLSIIRDSKQANKEECEQFIKDLELIIKALKQRIGEDDD